MTVYKKHTRPDKTVGVCNAKVQCPFGSEQEHFYYDTSVNKKVLSPNSVEQKKLDTLSSTFILENATEVFNGDAKIDTAFNGYYENAQKTSSAFDECAEKMIQSYPIKHQSAVSQLLSFPEGAASIASFDIFDPDEEDWAAKSTATDEEKSKLALTYLNKTKAEDTLRAYISSSYVK